MKTINAVRLIAIVITLGFAVVGQSATADERDGMAKVTGIGGVFFLSRGEGKELSAWYEKHLGMRLEDFGAAILKWEDDTAEDQGITVWHVADHDSDWFSPGKSNFMINYRVDNMARMIEQLNAGGINILKGPEYHENGVFAWIMDPEGNKIELWEPMTWDEKNKK
jgi:predicted enzyme related to lactoylglutathione lyase